LINTSLRRSWEVGVGSSGCAAAPVDCEMVTLITLTATNKAPRHTAIDLRTFPCSSSVPPRPFGLRAAEDIASG